MSGEAEVKRRPRKLAQPVQPPTPPLPRVLPQSGLLARYPGSGGPRKTLEGPPH